MSHVSSKSIEVGSFDVDAAESIATAIVDGEFKVQYETPSARHVVEEGAHKEILSEIGYVIMPDTTERQNLRTRIYAQELSNVSPHFVGLMPHVDIDNRCQERPKRLIDFYFGFSSHPPVIYHGEADVDIDALGDNVHVIMNPKINEADQERLNKFGVIPPEIMAKATAANRADNEGLSEQFGVAPGGVYLLPAGTIHHMAPIDPKLQHAPRLCIEQYLIEH